MSLIRTSHVTGFQGCVGYRFYPLEGLSLHGWTLSHHMVNLTNKNLIKFGDELYLLPIYSDEFLVDIE